MKKLLLIIALLISALGLNAQSVTIDDLEFTVTSETFAKCKVSGYYGEPTDATIPSTVTISGKEFSVTSIGDYAFEGCSSLTSIEIPSGVTSIGYLAFYGCSSLTSIEIPSGVTSIGEAAFSGCSYLTSIEIPSGVTSIGESAFYDCSSLTSIEFEENSQLTSIGVAAFANCSSLTSIEIPSGVTSIGESAFYDCSSLTSLEIPSGVTSIGTMAFSDCSSLTKIYCYAENVPETDDFGWTHENMVILVPEQSLDAYKAASPWNNYPIFPLGTEGPAVPQNLTAQVLDYNDEINLSWDAVEGAEYYNVYMFDELYEQTSNVNTTIYGLSSNTEYCFKVTAVNVIGESEKSEEACVMLLGPLTIDYDGYSLTFEITNTELAGYEVSGYSGEPTDVTIPSTVTISGKEYSVTSIGGYAFRSCSSLTSIEIPSSITSIGYTAFSSCSSLTSIIVENGNTVYDSRDNCNAIIETATNTLIVGCQNTVIPNTVSFIGDEAFFGCSSLTSIEIPSGVTSIGTMAFSGCSSLTSIEIPSGVTSIGGGAFWVCSSLTSIEIPSGVTSIGGSAFWGCSSLTSIEIPSGVTSIGDEAFYGCSSLTSIELPSSVTSIGEGAFSGCSSLTSIDFGENSQLTSIGEDAFFYCSSLTSIEIPSGVTSIGVRAFNQCSSLTSIVVESGNTVYDSRNDCNAIIETATNTLIAGCQNTVIPNTVSFIGDYAFWGCSSLTSIELPSGVTSIGWYAFSFCSSLTSIEIPSSVTSIGDYAFYYCSSLTSIYCYAEIVPETGRYVFASCPSAMVIYVPAISVNAYKATSPWNNYTIIPLAYVVTASSNPEDAGIITGTGEYTLNDTVTLKATANEGYRFVSWTENGELVSIEENYIFTIKGNRNLVAKFEKTYEITATVNPEKVGVVMGKGVYFKGDNVTLTAIAMEGYKFVNWTEDGEVVSENAQYSFVVEGNRNLVANFDKKELVGTVTYNVTTTVNPEKVGVVIGSGVYFKGDNVTLTAIAMEGYKFVNWTEDGEVVSENAQYSFVVEGNRNLVANFDKKELVGTVTYNVTTTVNPEKVGVVIGSGLYFKGDNVTLTAIAMEGYKFVNWTEDGEIVSENAQYSFVVEGNRNLVANFDKKELVGTVTYNVTATVNPEKVGVVMGKGVYFKGDNVTLTAIAMEGYKFVNWTEDGEVVSEDAQYSFVVEGNRNLVANFDKKELVGTVTYNVTTTVNPEKVGVVIGSGLYFKGDNVTLTAIPIKNGYEFVNWTEDGEEVSTDAQYSFVIESDRELVANFVLLDYYVSVAVSSAEAGEVTGDGNYNHGDTVALIATANEGYAFVNWTEDGEVVSSVAEYSFVILKDRNIVANFEKLEDPEQPEEPGEGVEELASSFNIYPNPVSDKLYIETQTQTQTVEIYDIYGRQQSMVNGQQSTVIDVSDLNSGVYFVKVVTSEGEAVKRFIKK